MATVKVLSTRAGSLSDSRRLVAGRTVDDVDETDPAVQALVADGHIRLEDADVPDGKVDDIVGWVGDDPRRAGRALAIERARPERDQRSTLIDRLEGLVGHDDASPEED